MDDLPVTSYTQTLVHIAAGCEPETAVPVLDAALRRDDLDVDDVSTRLRAVPPSGGRARGLWSLEFARPDAESPGESLSRVAIHRLRLPAPELQVRITDRDGLAGIVDFFWPDHRLAGEFDGVGKYLREAFTDGREPGEIVVAEKRREDRIRATSLGMARWGWDAARNPPALRRILSDAGLRAP